MLLVFVLSLSFLSLRSRPEPIGVISSQELGQADEVKVDVPVNEAEEMVSGT